MSSFTFAVVRNEISKTWRRKSLAQFLALRSRIGFYWEVNGGIRNYHFILWLYGPCSALGRWRLHLPCKCLSLLCFKCPGRPRVLLLMCWCWHLISEVSSEDWLCFDCHCAGNTGGQTHSAIGKHACSPFVWNILTRIEFPVNLQRHISPAVRGRQPLCLLVRASTPRFSPVFTPRAAFPLTGNWPITSFCLSSTNGAHKTDPGSEGGGM